MSAKGPMRKGLGTLLGCAFLLFTGCPSIIVDDTIVQMTSFSGRYGYGLSGQYGFTGSLTKEQLSDTTWRLEGEFTFPSTGYRVKTPEVAIAESYPEQVTVTLTVIPPRIGSIQAQVITKVPIEADIPASNQATFTIHIATTS